MNLQSKVILINDDANFLKLSFLYQEIARSVPLAKFNWNQESALAEIKMAQNLIFQNDDIIQSFVSYRVFPDRFEIIAIGTKPGSQKQGYSEVLLNQLKIYAAEHSFSVWLEVHEGNYAALSLYLKSGFRAIYRRKSYYFDGTDAIVMSFSGAPDIQS